jgi:hypothetical protein
VAISFVPFASYSSRNVEPHILAVEKDATCTKQGESGAIRRENQAVG